VGEAHLFTDEDGEVVNIHDAIDRLQEAEVAVRGHHVTGFGFHAFRRAFATKRKEMSNRDVAHYGGWKSTQTLEMLYQQPDDATMEEVATGGKRLRMSQDR
jgi:integrase